MLVVLGADIFPDKSDAFQIILQLAYVDSSFLQLIYFGEPDVSHLSRESKSSFGGISIDILAILGN